MIAEDVIHRDFRGGDTLPQAFHGHCAANVAQNKDWISSSNSAQIISVQLKGVYAEIVSYHSPCLSGKVFIV